MLATVEQRPGPSGPVLPVTRGSLIEFSRDPIACMQGLQRQHGEIAALEDGDQRMVFAFAPQYIQQILTDTRSFHSRFFAIRGPRNSPQRRLTCGLLSMNGDQHKRHRRMLMEPFQRKSIRGYLDSIRHLTKEMLDGWQAGEVIDVRAAMTQHMLRVTSAILFGMDVPEMAYRLGSMIDRWVELNHRTGMGALVSDREFNALYDELLAHAEVLEAEIRGLIRFRRGHEHAGNDVLSILLRAHLEEGHVDEGELIGHVALLFSAAHLTTAHSLTWTLFLLAQHPSVMRQVHEELVVTPPGTESPPEDLEGVLSRVIKESMRVLPASSYSQRVAAEPVQLGPFHLARGTPVVFSQFMTHHLSELYPDPETFRPDRWLEITPSPYEYLPFGTGPRMCLGGPLALITMKTALPMILNRFRLTVAPGAEVSGLVISTMLTPTTSVPMRVWPQDGQFESVPVRGNIHTLVDLDECLVAERASGIGAS